jgi:hypothetical protein
MGGPWVPRWPQSQRPTFQRSFMVMDSAVEIQGWFFADPMSKSHWLISDLLASRAACGMLPIPRGRVPATCSTDFRSQLWLEAEPLRLLNVSLCVQTSTSPDSWNIYRILGTTHSYEWWYSSPHACHWLQGLPPSLLLSSNSRFRCSCW